MPFKTCKCKNRYNLTEDKGHLKKYNCKNNEEKCESGYYDGDTNQCINADKCSDKYKKFENGHIRCTKKCNSTVSWEMQF